MNEENSRHNCDNCYWGDKCNKGGGTFTCEGYTPLDEDTYDEIAENEYNEILQDRNKDYDALVMENNDDNFLNQKEYE